MTLGRGRGRRRRRRVVAVGPSWPFQEDDAAFSSWKMKKHVSFTYHSFNLVKLLESLRGMPTDVVVVKLTKAIKWFRRRPGHLEDTTDEMTVKDEEMEKCEKYEKCKG